VVIKPFLFFSFKKGLASAGSKAFFYEPMAGAFGYSLEFPV
jgi:hypothetical protein